MAACRAAPRAQAAAAAAARAPRHTAAGGAAGAAVPARRPQRRARARCLPAGARERLDRLAADRTAGLVRSLGQADSARAVGAAVVARGGGQQELTVFSSASDAECYCAEACCSNGCSGCGGDDVLILVKCLDGECEQCGSPCVCEGCKNRSYGVVVADRAGEGAQAAYLLHTTSTDHGRAFSYTLARATAGMMQRPFRDQMTDAWKALAPAATCIA